MTRSETFKVDNQLIQWSPTIYGARRPGQLYLPGMEKPLGPFDEWATYGLYALLDPKDPAAPVVTTPTKLLEILGFARSISSALEGYETFPSENYQMVEEALHRLYSIEMAREGHWKVKIPGKRGPAKTQRIVWHGRILISYALIYPEGTTPAYLLPEEQREDVNRARGQVPNAPPIWRATTGPKPVGIEYRIHPDLVKGMSGDDPRIGATTMPFKIFDLRKDFGHKPTATRLLVWVMRQAADTMTRDLDSLAKELNLEPTQPSRNRDAILKGFSMLQAARVIDVFTTTTDETTGRIKVTFTKSKTWYLPLPEEEEAGHE